MQAIRLYSDCPAANVNGGSGVVQTDYQSTTTLTCDAGYTMYNNATDALIAANTFTFTCTANAVWDIAPITVQCVQGNFVCSSCQHF